MCLAFRCLPEDLDRMDAETYDTFSRLLRAEAAAGRLRAKLDDFHSSHPR